MMMTLCFAVSIHAFREEGDRRTSSTVGTRCCFNPRLPGGRRHGHLGAIRHTSGGFNPRLPGGRRRARRQCGAQRTPVSIHAFREEGDTPAHLLSLVPAFQSTPSGRKATPRRGVAVEIDGGFNPRLPGGRRQVGDHDDDPLFRGFNPRLPGGRRPVA